jgi:hypothetical protein
MYHQIVDFSSNWNYSIEWDVKLIQILEDIENIV